MSPAVLVCESEQTRFIDKFFVLKYSELHSKYICRGTMGKSIYMTQESLVSGFLNLNFFNNMGVKSLWGH